MSDTTSPSLSFSVLVSWGIFWLLVALVGVGIFFSNGINALLAAWQLPEYSHGPLIPILSGFLFLKQLKDYPPQPGPKSDRWPGVAVIFIALLMGVVGTMARIDDLVAYALILWIGGILLVSFGWQTGKHFWPGVLHLVYMLPLPGVIYYKVTTYLQFVSSELGVVFLRTLEIPVFLEGNIIDLGITKLHVAEACSGLRYMFPIMSFSYIFAAFYRGPMWHKAVLLLAAVPIAILMNSVRIAIAGIVVQYYGLDWLDGFTHFFEGWVIFVSCIILLFLLAWVLVFFRREQLSLTDALDLDTDGLGTQAMRISLIQPSKALITSTVMLLTFVAALFAMPDRSEGPIEREPFIAFPRSFDGWQQVGRRELLSTAVETNLGADDYHQVTYIRESDPRAVGLFMAWYDDQSDGGVHSPEVCLPGAGWEIAWIERVDIGSQLGTADPFNINRAIIQKAETRMLVYYWFQQKDRKIARDYLAKYWLMVDGIRTGRTDGALVRLTTMIGANEDEAAAEKRLNDMLVSIQDTLPRFIPEE